jgi:hypothetical protein
MATVVVNAGSASADIAVTRNAVFSLVTDQPVVVEAKNLATGGYVPIAANTLSNDAKIYIAPSPTIRLRNPGSNNANVEIG